MTATFAERIAGHSVPMRVERAVVAAGSRPSRIACAWTGLLAFLAASSAARTLDIDGLYTLYAGRAVGAGLPHHEQFTTAARGAWIDQQWLAQWLFYRVYAWTGYAGVTVLGGLLVATTAVLLIALMMRRGARPGVAGAWTGLAVVVLLTTPVVRTQAFAFPLFAATLSLALPGSKPSWRRRAWLVPLLVLWANLHGSVLLGAALALALCCWSALVDAMPRRERIGHVAIGALCIATPLATPYGLSVLHYYTSLIGNPTLRAGASEWQVARLSNPACWPYFALLLLATVAIARGCWRRRGRLRASVPEIALVAGFAALGIYAVRYMFWGAMVVAVVAATVDPSPRRRRLPMPRLVARALYLMLLIAAVASPFLASTHAYLHAMPVRLAAVASATADAHPGDVVLTDQRTSAALLWLHPHLDGRIAFDIRFEQYPHATLARYFAFLRGEAPDLACRYPIVAVSRNERPKLAASIVADPTWHKVHVAADGVVAVRDHTC